MIEKKFTTQTLIKTKFILDSDDDMGYLSEFDSSNIDRFILIIDENISEFYLRSVKKLLGKHNKQILIYEIIAEEKNKGLDQSIDLIKMLEKNTVGRFDMMISMGGGFISDITSFVASIYMRGIPYAAIPTTLIGQVDAVTAGKTCINGPNTKNLLGSFYFPEFVYNNINFLTTLPKREMRQGWSEILKYALLDSKKLIKLLNQYFDQPDNNILIAIINETIRARLKIREIDPLASNLGHTFGHAFEKISNYRISHGDAISLGTLMAIMFGEEHGVTKKGLHSTILKSMEELGLNTKFHSDFIQEEVASLMLRDKKSSSKQINLVLIEDIAKPYCNKTNSFFPTSKNIMIDYINRYFSEHTERLDSNLYQNLA